MLAKHKDVDTAFEMADRIGSVYSDDITTNTAKEQKHRNKHKRRVLFKMKEHGRLCFLLCESVLYLAQIDASLDTAIAKVPNILVNNGRI